MGLKGPRQATLLQQAVRWYGRIVEMRRLPYFVTPSIIRSLPTNLVHPPKPASPRRTGSGGNTGNALAVPRGQARQSGEPAFAAPLGFSDTPYPQYAVNVRHPRRKRPLGKPA